MVTQGDGTPLFFELDEKNRLVNKGPRQRPRTAFFRAYRATQENPVNRFDVPVETDFFSAELAAAPVAVPGLLAAVEPGNLATTAADYLHFELEEFYQDGDYSYFDAAGW
jgi:hypothetical protein